MIRHLVRWRIFVYAFIGVAVGTVLLSTGHGAGAAPLIDPNNINSNFNLNPSNVALPNADILSDTVNALNGIQDQMKVYAEHLFVLLVSLDVFWMVAQFLFTRDNLGEFIAQLATKVITVTFIFYVLIEHGGDLATTVIGSFTTAASNATANSNNFDQGVGPSQLLGEGFGFGVVGLTEATALNVIPDEVLGSGVTNIFKAGSEMLTGASLAIFGVYSGLAAEVAIATLEVYVVLNLGIIVTGFLGSRWTERFGQGFTSFAISAGVKFMFVQILLGFMHHYLMNQAPFLAIPIAGPAIFAAYALFCAAVLHAVPSFAASALSGQSNSSGAQLASAMSQVASGIASATKTTAEAPKNLKAANAQDKEQAAASKFAKDQREDYYAARDSKTASAVTNEESRATANLETVGPAASVSMGASTTGSPTNGTGTPANGSSTWTPASPSSNGPSNGQASSGVQLGSSGLSSGGSRDSATPPSAASSLSQTAPAQSAAEPLAAASPSTGANQTPGDARPPATELPGSTPAALASNQGQNALNKPNAAADLLAKALKKDDAEPLAEKKGKPLSPGAAAGAVAGQLPGAPEKPEAKSHGLEAEPPVSVGALPNSTSAHDLPQSNMSIAAKGAEVPALGGGGAAKAGGIAPPPASTALPPAPPPRPSAVSARPVSLPNPTPTPAPMPTATPASPPAPALKSTGGPSGNDT